MYLNGSSFGRKFTSLSQLTLTQLDNLFKICSIQET